MRGDGHIDGLDRRIIEEMREDPRVSYTELSRRLGVVVMTIRTRMGRLRGGRLLKVEVRPNFAALGLSVEVFGLVQADVSAIGPAIEVLEGSPAVLRADRISGEYDIFFAAAFATERPLGELLHQLQFEGIRRVVVHHQFEPLVARDGWEAAFAAGVEPPRMTVEAAGTVVPSHLGSAFAVATAWWDAFGNGEFEALRQLSSPDIVYTVHRPQEYAGINSGIDEVIEHSRMTSSSMSRFRREVVRVVDSEVPGFTLTLDALGTFEGARGQARDLFGRLSFLVEGGLVREAASLAELDLPSSDSVAG